MPTDNEKKTSLWIQIANHPLVQGPIIGATVSASVTPGLKWGNHVLNGERMPLSKPFAGAGAIAVSAIPAYAVSFFIKQQLNSGDKARSKERELMTSFVSGAFSGFVCTPFDNYAQNKQLLGTSGSRGVLFQIISNHGYTGVFRGGLVTMLREGCWSMLYMSAIPIMAEFLKTQGYSKQKAESASVVSLAGAYGLFSAPLNRLRFLKQVKLTEPRPNASYWSNAKTIFNQEPEASYPKRFAQFFKAGVPRMITTTVAGALMVKGTEYYKNLTKP